jgi:hypothetical protein
MSEPTYYASLSFWKVTSYQIVWNIWTEENLLGMLEEEMISWAKHQDQLPNAPWTEQNFENCLIRFAAKHGKIKLLKWAIEEKKYDFE